ncbi:MAG: phosphoenolpyruvate--protein phosphotransferase [Alphaproteobacteria bacterium]|nr:phosphoenolpyruvate--protein phosphotransferase [Alphaproteobacteria bacterium]
MTPKEQHFEGLGVAVGIAIGPAYVRESGAVDVPERRIPKKDIAPEQKRLQVAIRLARRQIRLLQTRTTAKSGVNGEELVYLLDAYLHMLQDSRLVRGAERRIAENQINAEAAVNAEIAAIAEVFHSMDDSYISARIDDIREVGNRLLRNLTKTPIKPFSAAPSGSIVIAEQLSPADTAQLDPDQIGGAATVGGSAEGHTAIMARALGLPTVLGASGLTDDIKTGDIIIVDGNAGHVIVNPTARTTAAYERRRTEHRKQTRRLDRLRNIPAVTSDGVAVTLQANVELPIEMDMVTQAGAEGIGLLRSEFMFMNRDDIPSEDEQVAQLKSVIGVMGKRPVTVRTLDVGAEKPVAALLNGIDPSAVSNLGLRGIRLSLAQPNALETQFRAILRAANSGAVRILLPMISTVSEVRKAREILKKSAAKLTRRGVKVPDPLPPLGVMIEVPGAALAADALAQHSDFFAIGSNDLTMYTLAIDRGNEHVAHLFDPLHPGLLRLMEFSANAALRARIPISICGEIAGDPRFTALLLGFGIHELSMTPSNIPLVKQRIRELDMAAANHRAAVIMDQVDAGRIAMLLDDFNALA